MSTQIDYYKLDELDADSFKKLLQQSIGEIDQCISQVTKNADGTMSLLDLATAVFTNSTLSKLLLLLARLPVFSKDFEVLFMQNLDVLQILKKLKFFLNLNVRETLYLLAKLSAVHNGKDLDITGYFSDEQTSEDTENVLDLRFHGVIKRGLLFPKGHSKQVEYMKEFEHLENIEPHAVYPTSIYRQSDGCTVATHDSQKIEAVMSTTLTTSIRIASHVLAFESSLLAEIYRPLGRVVMIIDDKLTDLEYTNDYVKTSTNERATLDMDPSKEPEAYTKMTIAEQIDRYFAHHNVKVTSLIKSGNETEKDIKNVQDILIEMKKMGVMRNEPVLVVGGGVIADIAGFALALFHRNTPYVMLNTSIVTGIDAGPSPRTCSDGQGYKNAFGAYHPPVVTLTDRTLWKTMHVGMIRHGIAEIVKMACVENSPLFELLEKVNPEILVKTKFGTDLSTLKDIESFDESQFNVDEFDYDCERIVGMAMESYVRAEYGNLWETHQLRPHAFGHTWSPGYELPAGMLHGHAVATCMGFGAFLSWKHCDWISEDDFRRICVLINKLELALWHDVMDDKQIFHASTKKMIQKRGGNLAAPIPRGKIGKCGYLNDITNDELSQYVDEYKELVTKTMGLDRNGYGVEPHLHDVGLDDFAQEATAHIRAEDEPEAAVVEDKVDGDGKSQSYQEWIKAAQTGRNSQWKFNVTFDAPVDTAEAPAFPQNTLFHENAESYAMAQTSVSSANVQVAAQITTEEDLFAPCMVGTLESQFLKMYTKTTRAARILDIGTFTGMSAIAFAEGALASGNADAHVDTLEFDDVTAKAAQKIFDHCEPKVGKAISLHQGDAIAWMEALADQEDGPTYDIIFIDADKENYVAYYDLAMGGKNGRRSLLSENGVILADNSLSALLYDQGDYRRVALHKFNQHVKNDDRVEQVVLTMREGITMISRK